MTDFAERVGTNGDDRLRSDTETIAFGLRGNDTLSSRANASYQVLAGGEGDDEYRIGSGHRAVVIDDSGTDRIDVDGISFSSRDTVLITLDDRHLAIANTSNVTEVYITDYRSSSISTIEFDDGGMGLDDLLSGLASRSNYLGDFSFDRLRREDPTLPSTSEARSDFSNARAREAQLQEIADTPEPQPDLTREEVLAVARLYGGALGRQPDVGGVNYWIDQAEGGQSRAEAARLFLDSIEFTQRFGDDDGMTNARFIDVMYDNVLGRDQDAGGFDYWVGQMDGGLSREGALLLFADSPENVARSAYLEDFREVADGDWAFI